MKQNFVLALNSIFPFSHLKATRVAFLAVLFSLISYAGIAAVTVTPASGGTNICSTVATSPTSLGVITISEGATTDFPNGSSSITLAPPAGWQFVVSLPSIVASGGDVSIGVVSINASNLTINFNASGTGSIDVVTITGLQIQATSPFSLAGNINASLNFGISGIITGSAGTNFGSLSIQTASAPSVTIAAAPSSTVCAGSPVVFTPTPTNGGASPTYNWFVNGGFVGSGGFFSSSTLANGNNVNAVMTVGGGGCIFPSTATSNTISMTVNALPNTPIVFGAGTFCGTTTINSILLGPGTLFFQGTTSGGTSTVLGGSPQTITTSGTYYFRARSAAGCWGPENSVAVTINPAATANAGAPVTMCAGETITLGGVIGGSATSSTWSAPSGTFSNVNSLTSTYTPSIAGGTVTLTLTTDDPDGAGPCAAAVSTVLITVNPIPNPVSVTGSGTFCGSTSISASLVGPGGIFFQDMTSGGTSTTSGGTPQTITSSGTYFFRALRGGCWGPEGSATVTINPAATANAGTPQSVCAGGTITLAGSIGGSATSSTWSAGSGTFSASGLLTSDYTPSIPGGSVTLTLTTNDPDGAGPCAAATSNVLITVNPLPNTVTVSGGGTFCNTASLTASLAGPGTIFFQGTTSGGTSTALGGTPQTVSTSGTYFFRARSGAGCWGGEGSAAVTINPLPNLFSVTGGGSYCSGSSGVDIGLSSTEAGVNYQLFRGATPVGVPVAGTLAAISFGLQTTAGTYTVVATNPSTGCFRTMTGSANVAINALPTTFTVTAFGPTSYCAGGAGVNLFLLGSASGISYQVMLGGLPVGAPVAGTGGILSLGAFTGSGAHTVIATNTTTGCTNTMTGSVNITINSLPTAFSVIGGGGYCSGGTGVTVGLGGSSTGVNYQLFRGATPVGGAVAGTGAAISFGLQTTAGTYTVTATNASTTCQNAMTGSAIVTINPLPTLFTVTGGGSYCSGGTGVTVGLSGSAIGVNYQLFAGATPVGSAVPGTGAALDFGLQTIGGTYIVVATDATTLCVRNMTGSVTVTVLALPTAFTVTGGGSYCLGGPGVDISLSNSTVGVTYELFNLFTTTGIAVAGTGGPISFGFQTTAGFYTVVGTNTSTTCTNSMAGGVAVTIIPLPTAYTVTGGGGYCVGGAGISVGLSGSDLGVDYQLYNGVTPIGSPIPGTGVALDFGLQTLAGAYTVVATETSTTCVNNMSGFVVVTINTLPNTFAVTGGGVYCEDGAGVSVGLAGSDAGVNYQLFNGATAIGSPMAGTGAALDFGLQTLAGTYTVVATDATTGCTNTMSGTAIVIMDPAPFAYTVIGGGSYCTGGAGVNVGLSGSDAGIDYQLFYLGSSIGSPVAGTGLPLDFGLQTGAGLYTVVATNTVTTCTKTMAGSTTISINPLPNVYGVTGGGVYCAGGTGVNISLSNSDAGVNYQLFNGASPVGSPLAGTGTVLDFGFHTATGTYTIVATDATTGCNNTMSGSATVSTNPLPTAYSVTGGGAYCVDGTGVAVGLGSSDLGIAYQLYEGTTTVGAPVTGTGLAINFGLMTTPGIYTVMATNTSTTCTNPMTGFVTVSVSAYPVVAAIMGSTTVCESNTTTFTNDSTGGVWSSGSPAIATVGASTGVVTGVSAGTATITYTITNGTGCATSVTMNVTVLASPTVAAISGLSSVCQGQIIHLSNTTAGGVWSSSNTATATVSTSGNVTGVSAGIVFISYTVTSGSGCTASAVLPITVGNAMPTAALLPAGSATLCHGNPATLNVIISDSTGISYTWYLGGVLIPGETNSWYIATTSGMYTARIDNGTCFQEFSGTNVMDPPVASITLDTLAGLLFTGPFVGYQWFINGTAIPGATNNNVTPGPIGSIMSVVVTDVNGCTDTSDIFIVVPLPISVNDVIASKDIKIYPNPTTSVLHIDAPARVFVSVMSADGKVLIERKEAISLNVGQLADGMYMISIYDENNNLVKTEKFVKIQ